MIKLCILILLTWITSSRILSADHHVQVKHKHKHIKNKKNHTIIGSHKHHSHHKFKHKRKLNEDEDVEEEENDDVEDLNNHQVLNEGGEDDIKHLKIPGLPKGGLPDETNIDLATGEQLGRELMLTEVEYPQIGIVNLDSGDFLLNIS